jgi:hypothetical protein
MGRIKSGDIMKIFARVGLVVSVAVILANCVSISGGSKTDKEYKTNGIYETLPENTDTMRFYEQGNGFLVFNLYRTTRFKLLNGKHHELYCDIEYKVYGSPEMNRREMYLEKIKVDGKQVRYSMESLEPFEKDGKTFQTLKVRVGENEYFFDFIVETIPVSAGMDYDEIIRILGEPDEERKDVFDTWTSEYHKPDLDNRYHSSWKFIYDRYPGYVLRLDDDGNLESLGVY